MCILVVRVIGIIGGRDFKESGRRLLCRGRTGYSNICVGIQPI